MVAYIETHPTYINTSHLKIIQHELRNPDRLLSMMEYIKGGGKFTEDPMEIAMFPDGELYVHNGHHRAVAIFLQRVSKFIYPEEFYIKQWKYEDYMDININVGYVTPLDIRTEARLADISGFKKNVFFFARLQHIEEYIKSYPQLYKTKKERFTVSDLAAHYTDIKIYDEYAFV